MDDDRLLDARHPPARPDRARRRGRLARRAPVTAPASAPPPPGAAVAEGKRLPRWPAPTPAAVDRSRPEARRCGRWPGPPPASPTASTRAAGPRPPGHRSPARKARRAARWQRAGQTARITSRCCSTWPAPAATSGSRTRAAAVPIPGWPPSAKPPPSSPTRSPTLIRYAVATTAPAEARTGPDAGKGGPPPRSRARGCAAWRTPWPCAALLTARNWLAAAGCAARAARELTARWFPSGDLLVGAGNRARSPGCRATRRAARPGPRRGTRRPPPPAIPLPGPDVRRLGSPTRGPRPVGLAVPDARHDLRICGRPAPARPP